jgi:ribosomal protein S18 acetylase RimI-like enzyme
VSSEAIIRKARLADVAAIVRMEAHFPTDRMSAATVRRFLRVPSAAVWVAAVDEEIAGSLVLLTRRNTRVARIYSVVVSPKARGQGLAQKLVNAAETYARKHRHFVALEVREDNAAARALYRKLGYHEVLPLPCFYEDGADGLRLRKALRTA